MFLLSCAGVCAAVSGEGKDEEVEEKVIDSPAKEEEKAVEDDEASVSAVDVADCLASCVEFGVSLDMTPLHSILVESGLLGESAPR